MMKRLAKMAVMAIAGSVMFFNGNVIAEEIEAENAAGCVEEVEEDEESEKIEEIIEKELHEIEEAKEDKVPASEEEESFEEENPEEESFEEECFEEETFEEEYFEEETFEEEYFEEETFEESFEEEEEFITIEDYDTPLGLEYTQEEMEEAAREQQEAQEKQEEQKKQINQENMRVTIYTSRQDSTLPGEQITLSSQIEGFEDVSGMAYQWMADKGAGFEPVSGANGASYTFTADEENMGWNWRLMVYFC